MRSAVVMRLWSCLALPWLLLAGASASAGTPWTLPAHTVQPSTTVTYLGWDGRALTQVDTGLAVGLTSFLTVGAAFRGADGHGRDVDNSYASTGYGVWSDLRLPFGLPAVVHLEHSGANVHLRASSPDSSLQADPTWAATGVELRTGAGPFTARTGGYQVATNGLLTSTVYLLGGGVRMRLARWLHADAGVTGFVDNYQTRTTALETTLSLHAGTPRVGFTLGAGYYPRGVPLAGTALSTASTIGAVYGSDAAPQLHTAQVGFVSMAGTYRF